MANTGNQVQVALNDRQTQQVQELLGDPTVFPQIFKNWVSSWTQADTTTTLAQIEGWSSYQTGQASLDASQDSQINSASGSISNLGSSLAAVESDVTALQNGELSQNSTLSTHSSQISGLQTSDGSQNTRLAALEAYDIPRLISSDITAGTVAGSAVETTLSALTVPGGTLSIPSVCEFHGSGFWASPTGRRSPGFVLYFATQPIFTLPSFASASNLTNLAWEIHTRCVPLTTTSQLHSTELKIRGLETSTYTSDLVLQQTTSSFLAQATTPFTLSSGRAFTLRVANGDSLANTTTTCIAATLSLLAA